MNHINTYCALCVRDLTSTNSNTIKEKKMKVKIMR